MSEFNPNTSTPFILYRAVVEDNTDPKKLGRVKVRIHGLHTEKNEKAGAKFEFIGTSHLPWAEVMGGTGLGLVGGVGLSSVLRQGTWVWVALENDDPNKPLVLGTIAGKVTVKGKGVYTGGKGFSDPAGEYPFEKRVGESDLNRLARNEKLGSAYYDKAKGHGQKETIHKIINDNVDKQEGITDGITGADVSQTEPNSLSASAKYPNSTVCETHSGHVIEIDDTTGNERIRIYHRTGSYVEIRPDGSFVQKSVGTDPNHFIAANDLHQHIEKGVKTYIEKNLEEIIKGNFLKNVKGNLKLHVGGDLDWQVDGKITIKSGGSHTVTNGGGHKVTAPRIDLN